MGVEDGAQQQQQYDLSANWGNILVLVCSLPMVGLMFLNPISLFLGGCALFWAVVLTFVPKLLYFVLLEYYISCGRGADFYHTHHSRRISADDTHKSLERLIVRASGFFGGVEAMGRKMVAQARKQYAERPLSAGQMGGRLVKLPVHIWPCAKLHVSKFYSVASHQLMKFVALNVIAKLYTKTPLSAEVAAVSQ